MKDSLERDFGVLDPKIAVLGLNPHCGDGGLLGDEEQRIILPAVQAAQAEGIQQAVTSANTSNLRRVLSDVVVCTRNTPQRARYRRQVFA